LGQYAGLLSTLTHHRRRIAMDKKWFEQLLKVLLIGLFLLTSVAKSEKLFPAHVNNSKIQLKPFSQAELKASKNMSTPIYMEPLVLFQLFVHVLCRYILTSQLLAGKLHDKVFSLRTALDA
jgi:hypothetical protein